MKVQMALTSHDRLSNTGRKTDSSYQISEKAADWAPLAVIDGRVATGQIPASPTASARALTELLAVPEAA